MVHHSKTKITPAELEVLIIAAAPVAITPDHLVVAPRDPIVQHNLKAKNTWGFDLSAACCGILYAIEVGGSIEGPPRHTKKVC